MLLRQLVQKENNRYALSKEQIRMITTASALHDIGKISIPDEILNKPGRLTAEEFAVIKGHSMAGANMLSELPLEDVYKRQESARIPSGTRMWLHLQTRKQSHLCR